MKTPPLKTKCIFAFIVLICLVTSKLTAQTSSGWRGPSRDGVFRETGLLKSWPEGGPELLWETLDVGKGYSAPVVVGNRIFLTGMNENEDRETFMAYTLNGQKIYEVEYGNPWSMTFPETRTTPTIVNGRAYVISGSGEIVCINIADGRIVWAVDGGKKFERLTGNWGTAESPLVFDNKVIYTPAGHQTTMVALNAQTGELVWKTKPLGDIGAYLSPILITHRGKRQIIGSTSTHIMGINPNTGEIEWAFKDWGRPPAPFPEGLAQGNPMAVNVAANTPLFKDGRIFFSHAGIGGYMLQLNDNLTGVSLLWHTDSLGTDIGGYVLVDGIIYGANWITNARGDWAAIDWYTGELKYKQIWEGKTKGSIVAADGMLYCIDERRGFVALVRPNPKKFDIVSEFRRASGQGPLWAHPVISNGVMYIRHGNALMAYRIR
jgi:outer membrane protein assembly factor BamB